MSEHYPGYTPPPAPTSKGKIPVWVWWAIGAAVAVILTLVLALSLGGDDKDAKSEPAPTVTVTKSAEPTKEAEPKETMESSPEETTSNTYGKNSGVFAGDAEYISIVKSEFPILVDVPAQQILELSWKTCERLDSGASVEDTLYDSLKDKLPAFEDVPTTPDVIEKQNAALGGITGYAIENYCPQHVKAAEKFLTEQGV